MRRASRKLLRLRELREERGSSPQDLAQQSGVGRSTIAALETGERGAHPPLRARLRRRLGNGSGPLQGPNHPAAIAGQARRDGAQLRAASRKPRDAFSGIEYEADLERMAEQFVVELGWLQERTFRWSWPGPLV